MTDLKVRPLQDDLSFGARVVGVTPGNIRNAQLRAQLLDIFEDRGLIVFENVEPSSAMQVALSNVFGPLKDHPYAGTDRVDQDQYPGVIDMLHAPETCGIVELDGRQLSSWLPWHFDHCYNDELNRAGVLRAAVCPPGGAMTGFADGLQIYRDMSPEIRDRIEGHYVIYTLDMIYDHMRFGRPEQLRDVRLQKGQIEACEYARTQPRALHPTVWARDNGEKVLHISPWMAVGLENHEDPEGDTLLEAACQEMRRVIKPYYHQWNTTDMLIWDNWRLLHCVSGNDPSLTRRMHRTTIKGDYGLGRFEHDAVGGRILEDTMV